ncbi:hypothetical protein BDV06DRAFT_217005 [Aspergillus oleicola]
MIRCTAIEASSSSSSSSLSSSSLDGAPRQPEVSCELLHELTVPSRERGSVQNILLDCLKNVLLIGQTVLHMAQAIKEHTESFQVDCALLVDVATHLWQSLLVDLEHQRQCTFVDMKVGQNEIIDHAFKFVWEIDDPHLLQLLEFQLQVEILMFQLLRLLLDLTTKCHFFTKKTEMRVVAKQAQHNQIRIKTIQTMANIRIVQRLRFRVPDVLHDLVFTFTRYLVAREYNVHSLPILVLGNLLADEILQLFLAVEGVLLRHLNSLRNCLLFRRFSVEGRSESSGSLLVHLRTWCDTINSHEEELLWFDLPIQMFDIIEDGNKHFIFGHSESRRVTVFV